MGAYLILYPARARRRCVPARHHLHDASHVPAWGMLLVLGVHPARERRRRTVGGEGAASPSGPTSAASLAGAVRTSGRSSAPGPSGRAPAASVAATASGLMRGRRQSAVERGLSWKRRSGRLCLPAVSAARRAGSAALIVAAHDGCAPARRLADAGGRAATGDRRSENVGFGEAEMVPRGRRGARASSVSSISRRSRVARASRSAAGART